MKSKKSFLFAAVLLFAGSLSAYAQSGSSPTPTQSFSGPTAWKAVSNSRFGTSDIRGIAFGGGRFVAGSSGGKIAYADW